MKRAIPYLALLVCVAFGYLGHFTVTRIVYQYQRSTWFRSLGPPSAADLRRKAETTYVLSVSGLSLENTLSSIQSNINYVDKIRSQAPQELQPVLDLRLAKDYAMMACLEQQSGSPSAAGHRQSAEVLLHSLGWTDASESAVARLGDEQLRSRFKR